jgi:cell fate (sporulation/competence/biofilm development) regulator YlbF (YheA/YmcA/DUF963 family)
MEMEKAFELGRLLGQGDAYKMMKRAQDGLEEATELRPKFERMEQLAQKLQEITAQGTEPPQEDVEEYDRLFSETQADPRYQQLVVAQSNFDKVMLKVQERIAEGMRKGAESSIITLG